MTRKPPPSRKPCSQPNCSQPREAHGLCMNHYRRLRRTGRPGGMVRAAALVDASGCWLWQGSIHRDKGYALIRRGGRTRRAHRYFYEVLIGPVPDGLELDHLCRVRHCVNPDHLEPVSHAVNLGRARTANR